MPFISISELFGNYVIVIDSGLAVFLAFAYFALAMSVPYLANRPQPVPHWNGRK